jgi:peptidyl-prolyl cis-trans isomerase A (cyclophilin A)
MKASLPALLLSATLLCVASLSAQAPRSRPRTAATKPSVAPSRPSLLNPASLTARAPANFKIKFATSAGDFVVEVHRDWAPLGADRFYNLVRRGFFTNASFFRVVPGFVVQFGLSADAAVNKVWELAKIQDDPVKQTNKRGTIVFATAGRNTRTTQLFINFADNSRLDGMGFAPFGEVIEGLDVVDKIYAGYGEQPRQDLIVQQGGSYISKNFPKIDKINLARVLPANPPTSAAKPKTHGALGRQSQ